MQALWPYYRVGGEVHKPSKRQGCAHLRRAARGRERLRQDGGGVVAAHLQVAHAARPGAHVHLLHEQLDRRQACAHSKRYSVIPLICSTSARPIFQRRPLPPMQISLLVLVAEEELMLCTRGHLVDATASWAHVGEDRMCNNLGEPPHSAGSTATSRGRNRHGHLHVQ